MKSLFYPADISPAPVHPLRVAKKIPDYPAKRIKKLHNISSTRPPSDETVKQLNGIGREYPFCVYFKEKRNDPL